MIHVDPLEMLRSQKAIGQRSVNIINFNSLSFYKSKMILDCPNCFGRVQTILVRFKMIFYNLNLSIMQDLDLTKPNWTQSKQLLLDQNYLDGPKSFWTHRRTRHKSDLYYFLGPTDNAYCGLVGT